MANIDVWTLIRWLHLLAAMAWVGGMLFILVVLLPIMRKQIREGERIVLASEVGQRYLTLSLGLLAVLAATGVLNALRRGVTLDVLFASAYGQTLGVKVLLVLLVAIVTAVHGLVYGPMLRELAERSADGSGDLALLSKRRRTQRRSTLLSAVNLLLSLAIVLLAASLVP